MKASAALIWIATIMLTGFALSANAVAADPAMTQLVLNDQFDLLPSGMLQKVLWARAEYHYLPDGSPKGPWTITAYSSAIGSQRAWKVVENGGRKGLLQTYTPESDKHTHPMVIAR